MKGFEAPKQNTAKLSPEDYKKYADEVVEKNKEQSDKRLKEYLEVADLEMEKNKAEVDKKNQENIDERVERLKRNLIDSLEKIEKLNSPPVIANRAKESVLKVFNDAIESIKNSAK